MMYGDHGAIIDRVIGEKAAKHVGFKQQNKIAESKVTSDLANQTWTSVNDKHIWVSRNKFGLVYGKIHENTHDTMLFNME